MRDQDSYIENKVQNMFTAYLVKALLGVRRNYLKKQSRILLNEQFFNDVPAYGQMNDIPMEQKNFTDLESQKLLKAVMWIKDAEQEIIYLHIFEEKTFVEVALKL